MHEIRITAIIREWGRLILLLFFGQKPTEIRSTAILSFFSSPAGGQGGSGRDTVAYTVPLNISTVLQYSKQNYEYWKVREFYELTCYFAGQL